MVMVRLNVQKQPIAFALAEGTHLHGLALEWTNEMQTSFSDKFCPPDRAGGSPPGPAPAGFIASAITYSVIGQ
jgi:hypothetical protein